jgi:hypothetical protein
MKKIFKAVLQPINVVEETEKKTFKEDLRSQHVSGDNKANFNIKLLKLTIWPKRMEYTGEITWNLQIPSLDNSQYNRHHEAEES